MKCPLCGSDNWVSFHGRNADKNQGLSVVCYGPPKGDYCGWSIHLTREQMIEAAFLITQHERTAAKEAA